MIPEAECTLVSIRSCRSEEREPALTRSCAKRREYKTDHYSVFSSMVPLELEALIGKAVCKGEVEKVEEKNFAMDVLSESQRFLKCVCFVE